jgi:hypothetical protein
MAGYGQDWRICFLRLGSSEALKVSYGTGTSKLTRKVKIFLGARLGCGRSVSIPWSLFGSAFWFEGWESIGVVFLVVKEPNALE